MPHFTEFAREYIANRKPDPAAYSVYPKACTQRAVGLSSWRTRARRT